MCMFDAVDAVCRSGRHMIACVVGVLIVGPVLLIIGIVILLTPNTRLDDVKRFNEASAAFSSASGDAASLRLWNGSVKVPGQLPIPYSIVPSIFSVSGSTEGIDSGSLTTVFAQSQRLVPASTDYNISSTFGPSFTSSGIATFKTSNVVMACSSTRCSSSCSSTTKRLCTSGDMANACRSQYGVGALWFHSNARCTGRANCGTCTYPGFLSGVCFVAMKTLGGAWLQDPTFLSCTYPFREQQYSPTSQAFLPVQVRANTDPFIVLQRITQGTNDFGITELQQNIAGLSLIIVGAIVTAAVGFPIYILCCRPSLGQMHHHHHQQYEQQQQQQQQQQQPQIAMGQEMKPMGGANEPYSQQQPYPPTPYPAAQQPQGPYGAPAPYGEQPPWQHQQQQPAYGAPPAYPPQQQPASGYPVQQPPYGAPPQQQQQQV